MTTLLKWHEGPKPGDGKVDERRAKWKAILESGKSTPIHEQWKDDKEEAMTKLETEAVLMKKTAFGCLKEQHKQELFATFKAMSPAEKAKITEELDSAGEEGMNYGSKEGKKEEDDEEEVAI